MHTTMSPSVRGVMPQRASIAQHGRTPLVSTCSFGGGRGRGGRGGGPGSDSGMILGGGVSREFQEHLNRGNRIILPNQQTRSPGAPGQLLVPGDAGFAGILDASDSVTTPTTPNRYRPPAGFMNEQLNEDETANVEPAQMLQRLQAKAGKWYTLAKFIPSLNQQNYDSSVIEQMTGITPAQQSKLAVAGTVYESLKLSGNVPPETMAAFDEHGEELLYAFRFLGVDFRVSAAIYLVKNQLEPEVSTQLHGADA
jgi:hypothetical protein